MWFWTATDLLCRLERGEQAVGAPVVERGGERGRRREVDEQAVRDALGHARDLLKDRTSISLVSVKFSM